MEQGWGSDSGTNAFDLIKDDGARIAISGRTVVGSAPVNPDMALPAQLVTVGSTDLGIAPTHAVLDISGGRLLIVDLGTAEGTRIDGPSGNREVSTSSWAPLDVGETIILGAVRLTIGERSTDSLWGAGAPPVATQSAPIVTSVPTATAQPAGSTVQPLTTAAAPVPPAGGAAATCTACGAPLLPDDRFCTACGAPVPDAVGDAGAEVTASAPNRSRLLMLIGAAVVVIAAIIIVLTVAFGNDDDISDPPRVPSDPRPAWNTRLRGNVTVTGSRDQIYVAVSDRNRIEVQRLDGADGAERWTTSLRGASAYQLAVLDDLVIVSYADDDFSERVTALGRSDGDEKWDVLLRSSETFFVVGNSLVLRDDDLLQLIDPTTGRSGARARAERWDYDRTSRRFLTIDDGEVRLRRASDLEIVAGPIRIGDRFDSLVFTDGLLLVIEDDEIIAFDEAGNRRWRDTIAQDLTFSASALPGGGFVFNGPDGVDALRTTDSGVERAWDTNGRFIDVFAIDGRGYVVIRDDDQVEIVDERSGNPIIRLVDEQWQAGLAGEDALVVFGSDRGDRTITAFDLPDGTERFRLADRRGSFVLLDGAIVRIEGDSDRRDIEVLR